MTAPEVPATSDPSGMTVLDRAENIILYGLMENRDIRETARKILELASPKPAEVPADEGTLDESACDMDYVGTPDGSSGYEMCAHEIELTMMRNRHATELQKARAEAVKGVLGDYRHRVQAAFEWPNHEHAMSTLAEIEFAMLAERFPIRSQEPPTGEPTNG